jgi:bacterioferritin-associated ferredoxin
VYICLCKGLTERDLEHCVRAGHTSAEALIAALGLDDPNTCGRCARGVDALVAATSGAAGGPAAPVTRGTVGTGAAGAAGQGAPGTPSAGVLAGAVHGPRGRHCRDVQRQYLGRGLHGRRAHDGADRADSWPPLQVSPGLGSTERAGD